MDGFFKMFFVTILLFSLSLSCLPRGNKGSQQQQKSMNTRELNTEWEKKVFNKNVVIVEDYALRTTTAEEKKKFKMI